MNVLPETVRGDELQVPPPLPALTRTLSQGARSTRVIAREGDPERVTEPDDE